MTVTVRSLLELEEAHLSLCAGEQGLDNLVRWVHVSEMLDPTPWMRGGEFLLTTGLRLVDEDIIDNYLDRVKAHGIAGIGFSTGDYLGMHATVPELLLTGAEARGIPLLEVPIDTPWVLISEYVSRRIAEEQNQMTQRAFDAQRSLTRVALDPRGHEQVVQKLASLIGGWAALTSPMGNVIASSDSSVVERLSALTEDLRRVRDSGSVVSISAQPGAVSLHPLGSPSTVRQVLMLGKDDGFDAFDRIVTASAVSLLSFASEQRLRLSEQRAAAAEVLGSAMLDPRSSHMQVERAAAGLGLNRTTPVRVLSLAGLSLDDSLAQTVHDVFSSHEVTNVTVSERTETATHAVIVQTSADLVSELGTLVQSLGAGARIGVSSPVRLAAIRQAHRQAAVALMHTDAEVRRVAHFEELSSFEMLIGIARPDDIEAVAATLLGPLKRFGPEEAVMRETLSVFLRENGRWEPAARKLGIHRQTLVKRIAGLERRMELSLQSADTRMSLWFALRADATRWTRSDGL